MKKVGVLGGGQLGMLLSQSIIRLGGEALVYDPDPHAPARRGVKHFINSAWTDEEALSSFFQQCDVFTYEFENVPSAILKKFVDNKLIFPTVKVLETTQNRALEKDFLQQSKLPHVNFTIAHTEDDLRSISQQLSFPVIIKSITGGYDGKLQHHIGSEKDLERFTEKFKSEPTNIFPATVEEAIDLHMEVSCITALDQSGEAYTFPLFENEHVKHILNTTLVPARISRSMEDAIIKIALSAAQQLGVVGLLCTEFFIAKTNSPSKTAHQCGEYSIFINEFAPRPHNSGHVTLTCCALSQFDALARILLGIPLSQPSLLGPGYFCMINLLGDVWLRQSSGAQLAELNLASLSSNKDVVDLVLYGKNEARPLRKMGHLVTHASSAEKALKSAKKCKDELSISP